MFFRAACHSDQGEGVGGGGGGSYCIMHQDRKEGGPILGRRIRWQRCSRKDWSERRPRWPRLGGGPPACRKEEWGQQRGWLSRLAYEKAILTQGPYTYPEPWELDFRSTLSCTLILNHENLTSGAPSAVHLPWTMRTWLQGHPQLYTYPEPGELDFRGTLSFTLTLNQENLTSGAPSALHLPWTQENLTSGAPSALHLPWTRRTWLQGHPQLYTSIPRYHPCPLQLSRTPGTGLSRAHLKLEWKFKNDVMNTVQMLATSFCTFKMTSWCSKTSCSP